MTDDTPILFGSLARGNVGDEGSPPEPKPPIRRRISLERYYGPILDRVASRGGATVLFLHRGRVVDQADEPGLERRLYLDLHRSTLGKVRSRDEALKLLADLEHQRGWPWWWRRTPLEETPEWR